MPRIPSVSDVRSVSSGAARDPGIRASAEDFGLAAARGLANLGIGVEDFGKGLEKHIREAKENKEQDDPSGEEEAEVEGPDVGAESNDQSEASRQLAINIGNTMAWDDVAASAQHLAWVREQSRLLIERQQYQGDSPINEAAQSQKDLKAAEEEHLIELSPQQREKAKEAAKPVVMGHALSAAQRSQNLNVEASMRKMVETLELLKGQAAADPASAEKFLADGLDLLLQSHEIGALSDAQLVQRRTAFRRDIYTRMLREQKASDVVADLEAGIYDAALDDPELTELLLIEHRWRMQGEEAQGIANGEAIVTGAAQGDEAQPALSDATRFLLEAGAFADFELEAEKARRVRSGVESLRFAPEDEFEGEIAKLAPAVAGLNRKARLEIEEAVRRGGERLLEERRADPADYAMGLPSVAKAFEAAKDDAALLPAAVSGRLAAQAAMGINPEEQRALSRVEAVEILESYRTLPAEARGSTLKALRDAYGDQCGQVAAELEEAGLPFQVVQALEPGSDGAPAAQAANAEQPVAAAPQGDTIAETAERLIAESEERSVPPLTGRRPTPPSEALRFFGDDAATAGSGQMPPIPERKSGSGLHASEEKLLNRYRPLLEEDEAKAKEGLDRSRVAGLEAIVEFKAQEQGAPSEVADLAKRLALRNLRRGYRFGDAVKSALIETDIEQPNVTLDTSIYMPRTTGDPVADSQVILDRIEYKDHRAPKGEISGPILERLLDLVNIREIERTEGQQGVARVYSMMQSLAMSKQMPVTHDKLMFNLLSFAERLRAAPYKHPWSLTGVELETAMSFLAERGKESADAAVLKNAASFLIDFVPFVGPTKRAARGGKRILKAIGISDAISAQDAAEALNAIVNEAIYRRLILPDRRLLPGIGLERK